MSPFAQYGYKMLAAGYNPLPLEPSKQYPAEILQGTSKWIKLSGWTSVKINKSKIDEWSSMDDAGICVRCGEQQNKDHFLVAFDIDMDEYIDVIREFLPASTVAKKGSKGRTDFYRSIEPIATTSITLGKKSIVDIICGGAQTVLPPSISPKTEKPYYWLTDNTLWDTDIDELPLIDGNIIAKIAEAIDAKKPKDKPDQSDTLFTRKAMGGETPHRMLNNLALDNLVAWVPALELYNYRYVRFSGRHEAVATWRRSQSGRHDSERKRNLHIHKTGILDYGDGPRSYTPIDLVMAARDCDLDAAWSWLRGQLGDKSIPERPADCVADDAEASTPLDTAVLASEYALSHPMPAIVAPAGIFDLMDPSRDGSEVLPADIPGLVGSIAMNLTSAVERPLPNNAILAALTTVGTLMGRVYVGPTGTPTNLFGAGIAPIGAGKTVIQKAMAEIFYEIEKSYMCSTTTPGSSQFFAQDIAKNPTRLYIWDELGQVLGKYFNAKASEHIASIKTIMLKAWSGTGAWATDGSLKTPPIQMHSTCTSIYGNSTMAAMQQNFRSASMSDGSLSRWTIVSDPVGPSMMPTQTMDEAISRIGNEIRFHDKRFSSAQLTQQARSGRPTCVKMQWHRDVDCSRDYKMWAENTMQDDDSRSLYMARFYEQILRIASIIAWGETTSNLIVTDAHINLAARFVIRSMRSAMSLASEIRSAEHDPWGRRNLHEFVLSTLRDGGGTVTRPIIMRKCLQGESNPMGALKRMEEMGLIKIFRKHDLIWVSACND